MADTEQDSVERVGPMSPTGKAWITPYVVTWLGTYALFAVLATWLYGQQLSDYFSTAQKIVWHGGVQLGPWLLGFGIGLAIALIGLLFTVGSPQRSRSFWWTALIVCWLFAALVLYSSWRAHVADSARADQLAEKKPENRTFTLDELQRAAPLARKGVQPQTFSVDQVRPAPPPIIAAITIQDTEGTSEADLSIEALKNLEQMLVANTLKKARARYVELGGDLRTFRPQVDSNAVYVNVGGKKLAVVRINFDNSVRSVTVMGFRGKEFLRVTCLRESNDEIPLFRGTCGDKITEAFGVSLR